MTRYFFDIKTAEESLLDYRGLEFNSQNSALDYAEVIAYDLRHSLTHNWSGWSVDVHDVSGGRFFSLAIDSPELKVA
jgi:hypothetical protein